MTSVVKMKMIVMFLRSQDSSQCANDSEGLQKEYDDKSVTAVNMPKFRVLLSDALKFYIQYDIEMYLVFYKCIHAIK